MQTESSHGRFGASIVLAMFAMVAVPAGIALHTVREAAKISISTNPTPYGYTWSLLLFLLPIIVIAGWLLPSEGLDVPRKAFWRTIAVLVPFGCALDFFFAHRFFTFANSGATLGIPAPALGNWVPIEEYVFYLTGFLAVLLIYVWLCEYWLAAYTVPDYPTEARRHRRFVQFHPWSLFLAAGLILAAVIYKKTRAPSHDGFPGYFTFLVSVGLIPAATFYPTVRSLINWRAVSLTLFLMFLVSLLWEGTLAIPYGWWGYQPQQMLGIQIGAWWGLPIEAVCVWVAVTYATAIVFEVMKLWQSSGRSARAAFLGRAVSAVGGGA